jgi:sugar transferase (PEP-CTERM system associated)
LKIFKHHVSDVTIILLTVETVIFIASVYIGAALRFIDSKESWHMHFESFHWWALLFALVMIFSLSVFGLYKYNDKEDVRHIFLRLMPSIALGFGILTSVFYLVPLLDFGRGVLGLAILVSSVLIMLVRVVYDRSFKYRLLETRVVFLGTGSLAEECSRLAMNHSGHHKYRIVGYVKLQNEETHIPAARILHSDKPLLTLCTEVGANEIVVAVNNRRDGNFPLQALLDCKLAGLLVTDASSFFEREASQIRVDTLQPSWLIFGGGFDQSFLRAFVKRFFDLFASIAILIVTIPIMFIAALLIYLEDRSPIFYKQERVGKDGESFLVLKFRSMRNDAEKGKNPQWASANDPRTTRVGRVIRKLRIDELPQIFNVFKGDMSFVGPRPERPFFVKQLCEEIPFYNVRHSIKPGITGLAQVRYQYGASVEDSVQKLQYDLYYVKNNSLFLDALILLDTFQVVVLGKGQ